MKPAEGLHVEWVDDEAVVLDKETGTLHYLNPPAALALALILEYGFERGISEFEAKYGDQGDVDAIPQLVDTLHQRGLLVEDVL